MEAKFSQALDELQLLLQSALKFKSKCEFERESCYHFHNILRLYDVLTNFTFTTNEITRDYYLQTWYVQVASRAVEALKTWEIRKY